MYGMFNKECLPFIPCVLFSVSRARNLRNACVHEMDELKPGFKEESTPIFTFLEIIWEILLFSDNLHVFKYFKII